MEATMWGLGSSAVEQSIWLVGLGFKVLGFGNMLELEP